MKKNIIIFLLTISFIVSFLALSADNKDFGAPHKVRGIIPEDEFPIGAFYTFQADSIPTENEIELVREVGINIGHQQINNTSLMPIILNKVRPHDLRIAIFGDATVNLNRLDKLVPSLTGQYDGLWGYYIKDEPNVSDFNKIRSQFDIINKYDSISGKFVNLWASWTGKEVGSTSFKSYINEYVDKCRPNFLSVDIYPVLKNGKNLRIIKHYYAIYEQLSRSAKEYHMPFFAVGLTTALDSHQWPNETNMRFTAFNALAYGAQAIIWWSYSPLPSKNKDFLSYPIDVNGKRTKIWYDLKKVNTEIHQLSSIFKGDTVNGVWHTGEEIPLGTQRLGIPPYPIKKINGNSHGVLVSDISNNGHKYVLLVNHDVINPQTIDIETEKPIYILSPNKSSKRFSGGKIKIPKGGYTIFQLD